MGNTHITGDIQHINKPADIVFELFSDFSRFQDKIPEDKLPKGTGQSSNDDVQKVFDVEKQDWRSFRWDSLKSFDNV